MHGVSRCQPKASFSRMGMIRNNRPGSISALNIGHTIFDNGFTKRNSGYQDPVLRFPGGRHDRSPDIIPSSAVCFTRDFKAAPLFPVSDLVTDSWVYVMYLDVGHGQVYNSQQVQWEYVTNHELLRGKVFDEAARLP